MNDIFIVISNAISIVTGLPPESIRPDTDLQKLKFAQWATLIMVCEKHYRIEIPDHWIVDFTCVQDLMDCIQREKADGRTDYSSPSDDQRISWYYE